MHATAATTTAVAKNTGYVVAFIVGMEWLGLPPDVLSLLCVLMVFDIITGVSSAYSRKGGSVIQSKTLIRGVTSKIVLLIFIFSLAITAKIVGFEADSFLSGAVSVIALGELYSIGGNAHSIRTGKPKHEFDALAIILKQIRRFIDKMIV